MLFLNVVGITDEAEHRVLVYFFAVFAFCKPQRKIKIGEIHQKH
jgi:hypothetical protein